MGLKHLIQIEEHLRVHKKQAFAKTKLHKDLNINFGTVSDVLAYFLVQGRVVKTKEGKYKWKE